MEVKYKGAWSKEEKEMGEAEKRKDKREKLGVGGKERTVSLCKGHLEA